MSDWMLYGAYGYSGRLILKELQSRGLTMPILAGRNQKKLDRLSQKFAAPTKHFDLDDLKKVRGNIAGCPLVLNAAGPFAKTFQPLVEACLREKAHYLDITGEIAVFERIYECDFRAKTTGVTLMPGVGFDVVPTDCLALALKEALPSASHLELAFATRGKISQGTLKTIIDSFPQGGLIRKNGAIQYSRPGSVTREIEFTRSKRLHAMAIPWGDISSAYRTTGIPNIVVYTAVPRLSAYTASAVAFAAPLLRNQTVQKGLHALVERYVKSPDKRDRRDNKVLVWGEVRDERGEVWRARTKTCNGYELTAKTAVEAVQRVLAGGVPAGSVTPASAFGSKFLADIDKSYRITCKKITK